MITDQLGRFLSISRLCHCMNPEQPASSPVSNPGCFRLTAVTCAVF